MRALIQGLPPDSALSRAISPETVGWTNTEELLATVIEIIDLNNRLFIQANSDGKTKGPEALKVPRPYQHKEREPKGATVSEIKDFFTDIRVTT